MSTEIEPRLRAWLASNAPSEVPVELSARVAAIARTTPASRGARLLAAVGLVRREPVHRYRAAWTVLALVALLVALLAAFAFAGARPPQPRPHARVFAPTGSMATPRMDHTATLLQDGRVLVAGGQSGGESDPVATALATAELYDPATGTFSPTGPMTTPRLWHAAVRLDDGRALVVGGAGGDPSADLYDPATGRFSATGVPIGAFDGAQGVLLADGRVLFVGIGGPRVAMYDPRTGSFASFVVEDPGSGASAAVLADGTHVLVIRGATGDGEPRSRAWVLDATNGTEESVGTLRGLSVVPSRSAPTLDLLRQGASVVPLQSDRYLIVGGQGRSSGPWPIGAADIYQVGAATFEPTGSLATDRVDPTVTRLGDGMVLVTGGGTWDGESLLYPTKPYVPLTRATDSAELYDPTAGTFVPTGSMTTPRADHSATMLLDGSVLVTGGDLDGEVTGPHEVLASAELYH
jgi:hypothetical protein